MTPTDTDPSTSSSPTDTGTDTECTPGVSQDCACDDGTLGSQVCAADGSGFGACDCMGGVTSTTGPDPDSSTADPTTGPPPECVVDADCGGMASGECEQDVCSDAGECEVQPAAEGTACGDATNSECSAPDTCDGRGTCSANDQGDGSACTNCPLGICACAAGTCGDCNSFAPSNNFITTRSVEGWTLTGDWALYREAPQNQVNGPVLFTSQVLGTNGNRSSPLPGAEVEASSARTPPGVLPANLDFLSWNVDEGSGFDTKAINVSLDGGMTFSPVFDCELTGGLPFCDFRDETRAADDWDVISIPLPPPMVGQVGIIEFTYNTGDDCCGFEKGWYVDAINFATECACANDASCAALGGDCGDGVCGALGECELDPMAIDTACGDGTDVECNAPDLCDGVGYCLPNQASNGLSTCSDCAMGAGGCTFCQEGVCPDCQNLSALNDFQSGSLAFNGWLIEDLSGDGADWQIYFSAPQNTEPGSVPVPLSFAPSFGTDGNRQAPYGGALQEVEHSRITTTPDTVPASIMFDSWNVDEGSGFDTKLIEISTDGGMTWDVLVDCNLGPPQPFCMNVPDGRLGTDWDAIVIDTAAYQGMVGQLRFTYNTGDTCCGFERGWFIDNLNFAEYCSDPQFPLPL
ncbi:MAG: hypothetical protein K0V04_11045 [Deltaproteobacteria bacterium]|nr:hypothetical protein [Deltaproteobacteria bacterium]